MVLCCQDRKTWCQDIRQHNSNVNFRKAHTLGRPIILTPKTVIQSISFLSKVLAEEENGLQGWLGLDESTVKYLYRVIFKVSQKTYMKEIDKQNYKFVWKNDVCIQMAVNRHFDRSLQKPNQFFEPELHKSSKIRKKNIKFLMDACMASLDFRIVYGSIVKTRRLQKLMKFLSNHCLPVCNFL